MECFKGRCARALAAGEKGAFGKFWCSLRRSWTASKEGMAVFTRRVGRACGHRFAKREEEAGRIRISLGSCQSCRLARRRIARGHGRFRLAHGRGRAGLRVRRQWQRLWPRRVGHNGYVRADGRQIRLSRLRRWVCGLRRIGVRVATHAECFLSVAWVHC